MKAHKILPARENVLRVNMFFYFVEMKLSQSKKA